MVAKVLACHTEGLLTRDEACGISKYHGCHTKQGYATFETSKSDRFCSTCQRHHIATSRERLRTVPDGCGRLRAVADSCATSGEHTLKPPNPQSETGTLATHSGKSILSTSNIQTMSFCECRWPNLPIDRTIHTTVSK